jgi:hypothetical protein
VFPFSFAPSGSALRLLRNPSPHFVSRKGEGAKEKRNPEIYRRIFGGSAQLKDRLQSAQLQRGRDDKRLALFATAMTSDAIFEIAPIRRLIKGLDVLFQELLFLSNHARSKNHGRIFRP